MTRLEGLTFLLPFLRAEHTCCLTAAILDFANGAFFEANRSKNHTLYLYLPESLICVKWITEVVFYFFFFSFTVKEQLKTTEGAVQDEAGTCKTIFSSNIDVVKGEEFVESEKAMENVEPMSVIANAIGTEISNSPLKKTCSNPPKRTV